MATMKSLLAEVVGSFILVFFGTASVVLALFENSGYEFPNAWNIGINFPDWIGIGLAFGLALAVAIYAFGKVSGAHFNPAVTIALWAGKKFPAGDVIPYIVAQFVGAIIATAVLYAIGGYDASAIGVLGSVGSFGDISYIGMFIAELVGTFLLMYVIMAVVVDSENTCADGAMTIGLVLAGIIIAIGNFTGCGINPARAFSPMLFNYFITGTNSFSYYPIYLIAPIIGAIIAVYLYNYFTDTTEQ